jgi:hypothetical protein
MKNETRAWLYAGCTMCFAFAAASLAPLGCSGGCADAAAGCDPTGSGSGGTGGTGGVAGASGTGGSAGTAGDGGTGGSAGGGESGAAGTAGSAADSGSVPDSGGGICGGVAGLTCPDSMFCDYPNVCGGDEGMPGECMPRPSSCTKECPGACGCDGMFYCNVCEAHRAGIDALMGACPDASTRPRRAP